MHQASHYQQHIADHEGSGQEVDELEGLGIFVFQDDPCLARVLHLTEERAERDTPLVIDKSFGKQTAAVSTFEDARAQVDVLAVAHGGEAAQGFIDAFLDAEVEAARVEFVHFFLAATDATRGEERGHRVVDGLLYPRGR